MINKKLIFVIGMILLLGSVAAADYKFQNSTPTDLVIISGTNGNLTALGNITTTSGDICIQGGNCLSDAVMGGGEVDPYWTGNSTLVPYLASANTFTANNIFNQDLTVDTNTLFVDASADAVGFNTSAPASALQVGARGHASEDSYGGQVRIYGSKSTNTVETEEVLSLARPFNSGVSFGKYASFKLGGYQGASNAKARLDIVLSEYNSLFYPNVTVMTLTGAGRVGVGITNPGEALDVVGNVNASGDICLNSGECLSQTLTSADLNGYVQWVNLWAQVYNESEVDTAISNANTSMKNYVDNQDTTFNNSIAAYVNSEDARFNTSMKNYVDNQDTTFNNSIAAYVNSEDTRFNNSIAAYVDSQDVVFNNSITSYVDNSFLRKDGDNGTGQYDFNGGWTSDGLSIIDGNLYAQTVFVYNISSLQVTDLNVNGSLIPSTGFDNQFDIGSPSLRWRDGYFGGDLQVNGSVYSANQIVLTNETDPHWTGNYSARTGNGNVVYSASPTLTGTVNAAALTLSGTFDPNGAITLPTTGITGAGTGSGLDADLLDGIDSTGFLQTGDEANLNVNSSDYWDGLNGPSDINAGDITDDNTYLLATGDTATGNYTFDTSTFFIDSSGNKVGIGTTSPDNPLEIQGALGQTGLHLDSSNGAAILIDQGTSSNAGGLYWQIGGADNWWLGSYNTQNLELKQGNYAGTNVITFEDSTGEVGIGTTNPQGILDVNANTDQTVYLGRALIDSRSSDQLFISHYDMSGTTGYALRQTSAGYTIVNSNSGSPLDFRINDNSQMRIASTGEVGIGTTTPQRELHVNGDILSNATINATGDICIEGGTCLSQAGTGSGDITAVNTNGPFLSGGSTSGDANLLFDTGSFNTTYDNRYYTQGIVDSLGNYSAWNKDYGDLINTPTALSDFTDDILWTAGFNSTGDSRWLGVANEANLNVNSSNYWDGLNTPSDINAGDITDDNTYLLATGDTATGDYNFDSGTLFVNSTGNRVGIGDSTPNTYKLEVVASDAKVAWFKGNNPYINIGNYDNSQDNSLVIGHQFVSGGGGDIGYMRLATRPSGITINGTNIGIGTDAPSEKLDVVGNIELSGQFETTDGVVFSQIGSGAWASIRSQGIDIGISSAGAGTSYGEIESAATYGINLNIDNTNAMFVNTSGVGIGTISPSENLDIYASDPVLRLSDSRNLGTGAWVGTQIGAFEVYSSDPSGASVVAKVQAIGSATSTGGYANSDLAFLTRNYLGAGLSEKMRITDLGYVGVGTTTPGALLDVIGNISSTTDIFSGGFVNATTDVCVDGGNCLSDMSATTGTITGAGTAWTIPMWNGTTSLNNSNIYQDGNGDIGIGVTSGTIAAKLQIGTTAGANGGDLYVFDNGGDPRILFGDSSSGGNWGGLQWNSASDTIRLYTDTGGTNQMVLQEDGDIGFGIASPDTILHVSDAAPIITIQRENNANDASLDFQGSGGTVGAKIQYEANVNDLSFYTYSGTLNEVMRLDESGNLTVDTDTLFVDALNNRVGIGVTDPVYKFEVSSGASSAIARFERTGSGNAAIEAGDGDSQIYFGETAGRFGVGTSSNLVGNGLFWVTQSGDVGIGEYNPMRNLHVNGDILSNATINATGDICIEGGTCLSQAGTGSGDITAVNTNGPFLSGGSTSGDASLTFNTGNFNTTYDNRYYTQGIVNSLGNYSAWNKDYGDLINTPTALSDFTDDLGNRGYTHLTNFTDDILWTAGFNSTGDSRWLGVANEANLNVNSSNYWDGLNTPSDINAGDITDDNTYVEVTGDTMTGDLNLSGATTHLILPLNNDAATPTISFGDGDTGIYQATDNQIRIAAGGGVKWAFDSNRMGNSNSVGGAIKIGTPSATATSIVPAWGDGDTGIGHATADTLSLIAGGVNGLNIYETGSVANVGIGTTTPATGFVVNTDSALFKTSHDTISTPTTWTNVGTEEGLYVSYDAANDRGRIASVHEGTGYRDLSISGRNLSFTTSPSGVALTERMRIDANGNVGIGTTTPGEALDVVGNIQATGNILNDEGTAGVSGETLITRSILTFGTGSTDGYIQQSSTAGDINIEAGTTSGQIFLDTAGSTALTVNADGHVGIGAAPSGLTIAGSSQDTHLLVSTNDGSTDTLALEKQVNSGQPVASFNRARSGGAAVTDGDNLGIFAFRGHDGTDYNGGASFYAEVDGTVSSNTVPTSLVFATTTTNSVAERMRIDPSGYVGIGTDAPVALLHINGSAAAISSQIENAQANGMSQLVLVNDVQTWAARVDGGTSDSFIVRDGTNTANRFVIEPGASSNDLYIDSTGYVGIGTATPGAKLDVVGGGSGTWAGNFTNTANGDGVKINTAGSTANNALMWYQGTNVMLNAYSSSGNNAILLLYDDGTADVKLGTGGEDSYIDSGAGLGIGMKTPGEALDVVGNINASGDICLNGGECLSNALTSYTETDPDWLANYSVRTGTGNVVFNTAPSFSSTIDVAGVINADATTTAISADGDLVFTGSGDLIDFSEDATDKVHWYSNTYGTGIESGTLTNWGSTRHRWRIGGSSVSSGTEKMTLDGTQLNITDDLIVSGGDLTVTPSSLVSNIQTGSSDSRMTFITSRTTSSNYAFLFQVDGGATSVGGFTEDGNFRIGQDSAADDDYLYFDTSTSEYLAWDDSPGEFDLSDDLNIAGGLTLSGTFDPNGAITLPTTGITGAGTGSGLDADLIDGRDSSSFYNASNPAGYISGVSDVWVNESGDTMTGDLNLSGATTHLILSLNNDAATPTISFGDGDTGFYQGADNAIRVSTGGSLKWGFDSNRMGNSNSVGGAIKSGTPSATATSIVPAWGDGDTGIGHATADTLSLIAGGVNGLNIYETGSVANVGIGTSTPGEKLEVAGNAEVTGYMIIGNSNISTVSNGDVNVW